ncbi:glucosyltransferase domain-containing protein [bacterium]|nr:glucosyltransferase domain-containing protein [bacterium]
MDLFQITKEKRKQFLISVGIVLFIHLLKFTNYYPNWDSVYGFNIVGYRGMNRLGRWFSGISLKLLHSPYDLQWVEGIISSIFIALSIMLILEVFEIKKPAFIYICTFLFAAFPSMVATFCYMPWAPSYMLALFMAVLAAYLCTRPEPNKKIIVLSILLLTLSLGIYQIYYTVAFIIFLYFLANQLLDSCKKIQDYKKQIRAFALSALLSMVIYAIITKIVLFILKTNLTDYQGISQSGQMSFVEYLRAIKRACLSFNDLFYGVQIKSTINIACIILICCGIIHFILNKKHKKELRIFSLLIFLFLIPATHCLSFLFPESLFLTRINFFIFEYLALNFVLALKTPYLLINIIFSLLTIYLFYVCVLRNKNFGFAKKIILFLLFALAVPLTYSMFFVSAGVNYHSVMELGIFFIYLIIPILLNHKNYDTKQWINKLAVTMLIILCFYHFINDNIAYKQMEISYKKTSFETTQVILEIDKLNNDNKYCIALIGYFPAKRSQIDSFPKITGTDTINFLKTPLHFFRFSKHYFGREFSACRDEQKNELKSSADFIEMPEYPKAGFAKIIDDMIVVKLHNEKTTIY